MKKSILECANLLAKKDIFAKDLVADVIANKRVLQLNPFIDFDGSDAKKRAEIVDDAPQENSSILSGIPISVKDNFMVKGSVAAAGSQMLCNYTAPYDATMVDRLLSHGAVVCGRANMDEFGMGSSMINSSFGPSINPWSPLGHAEGNMDVSLHPMALTPGGSTGGGAVAVRSYLSHATLGSDTGGSVRQPASFCGLVGLKPSYGRFSRHGLIAYGSSLDCPGFITRSITDSALLLQACKGLDANDPYSLADSPSIDTEREYFPSMNHGQSSLSEWTNFAEQQSITSDSCIKGMRIGIPRECFVEEMDLSVISAWKNTVKMLEDAGATVVEVSVPSYSQALAAYYILACAESSSNLTRYDGLRFGGEGNKGNEVDSSFHPLLETEHNIAKSRGEHFGGEVIKRILAGSFVLSRASYDLYYGQALASRRRLTQEMYAVMSTGDPHGSMKGGDASREYASSDRGDCGVDCLLSPTVPLLPFFLQTPPDAASMLVNDIMTVPANLAGLPALSVPVGVSSVQHPQSPLEDVTVPIGMQLLGPHRSEHTLLKIGLEIEKRARFDTLLPPWLQ